MWIEKYPHCRRTLTYQVLASTSLFAEGEERPGIYKCAGCGTDLFASTDKFHSGTGWPSFARGLQGVETEKVDIITEKLGGGAELRCRSCGGHLGDVFNDGFLFFGTEAAKTGKRYCIDGAALVFTPTATSGANEPSAVVRGDQQATRAQVEASRLSG